MNRQQCIQLAMTVALLLSLLTGCSRAVITAAPVTKTAAPLAVATVKPATPTLEPSQPTPTQTLNFSPGAPGIGDSLYPGFGNGGYDAQHYTLSLNVSNVRTSQLEGQTTLEAIAAQNLSRFNLDLIGFTIDAITVNQQPASFERDGQELTITPAQPLQASQPFVVQVSYHGAPSKWAQIGWITYNGGSYVLSEPDGAATYFPCNDHPLDKASYTFNITVPKPYVAAANGVLTGTTDQGKTTTFVWEEKQAMTSYLSTVVIGQFKIETETAPNGIPIRNYYENGLGSSVRKPFARQGEMLAFYSDTFGKYPFDVYGALILNTEVGTALENQTTSIFGVDQLELDDIPLAEQLAAHEMAHQWFGDSLSVADWSDIWLNEGFATYAEGLWIEHTEGRAALDGWVKEQYGYVLEAGNEMVPPGKPKANDLFNDGVYVRGGLTLHALRLQVGDQPFFNILHTYHERFKGGNVRTSDFIAVAEEISGQSLSNFFDHWLNSKKIPPIPSLGLKSN